MGRAKRPPLHRLVFRSCLIQSLPCACVSPSMYSQVEFAKVEWSGGYESVLELWEAWQEPTVVEGLVWYFDTRSSIHVKQPRTQGHIHIHRPGKYTQLLKLDHCQQQCCSTTPSPLSSPSSTPPMHNRDQQRHQAPPLQQRHYLPTLLEHGQLSRAQSSQDRYA
jgi:hypothetical protein